MTCKGLLVRSNKDPQRCPEYPRRCPGRLLFNFLRASRCHRNRHYRSSHPKVAARGKVHKISGHTRTKCKCLLVRSNKDPRRCPEYTRRGPDHLLFKFSRPSRRHRNRLYRSLHPKVAARRKVHKISGHTRTKCKCLLVRSNKDPQRCTEYPRRCPDRLLFNFSRASRRHQNRLYRSSHPKVAARGKVHKISGHTRGRNVNVC